MSDNWDKDLPPEGMRAKVNRKYDVSFVSLGRRKLARLLKCYRIGPGVGVGVDQEPGVGVGVGTAPPRLRTPDFDFYPF